MANYFAILTNDGVNKLANATALGIPLKLTAMAVGDGNGQPVVPDPTAKKLVNEKRRAPINTLFVDPLNQNQIVAEQILPENVGGWWIREMGLFDESGTLIAYANVPDSYKPILSEGSGKFQMVRMLVIVSNTGAIELKIDPSVVLATRQFVDEVVKAHKESRDHPDASETAKGFTRYATQAQTDAGTDDATAITPKKLKDWVKQASEKVTGMIKVASQAQTDAGTDDATAITPKKLKNWVKQASETVQGMMKVASQEQTDAGTDDATAITPKKLKDWVKQASETVTGMIKVASQAQTDAGTDDATAITPKKLKAWVKQASESVLGLIKVASQQQTDAGTADDVAVTPKKLKAGFSISLTSQPYVCFPSWLGGWIIQMGDSAPSQSRTTWPIAFPTRCITAAVLSKSSATTITYDELQTTGTTFSFQSSTTGANQPAASCKYIAIGN